MSVKRRKDKDKSNREATLGGSIVLAVIGGLFGFLMGVVHLAAIPPETVNQLPEAENIDPKAVYLVRGQERGGSNYRVKETALLKGKEGAYRLSEAELNNWARNTFRLGKKPVPKGEEDGSSFLNVYPGTPNFRIQGDTFQIATTLEVEFFGTPKKYEFQARGDFSDSRGVWEFAPDQVFLGSAEIPAGLSSLLFNRLLALVESDEKFLTYYECWTSLSSVKVEGDTLLLAKSRR